MLRTMRLDEADQVAGLIRAAFAAIPVPLDPAPSGLRVTAAQVTEFLTLGGGAVWDEDGPRGCVLWQERAGGLYLGRLAVQPGWQGRGIARALIEQVAAEAGRQGLPRILLEVRLALTANRRLFAACGFVEGVLRTHPGYDAPTFVEAGRVL